MAAGVWIGVTSVSCLHGGAWECHPPGWCELCAAFGDLCAGGTVRCLRERQVFLQALCGSPGSSGNIYMFSSLRTDISTFIHTFSCSAVQTKVSDL